MSAICGIYDVRGQAATGIELAAMTQALAAFGPEGAQHVTPESQGDIHPW